MEFRDELFEFLKAEIVGPRPGLPFMQINREEVLAPEDTPRLRYGAGILFPTRLDLSEQEDDEEAEEGPPDDTSSVEAADARLEAGGSSDDRADVRGEGQSETDQEVNRTNEFLPSALGLTALVKVPEKLVVSIQAAQYQPEQFEGEGYTTRDGCWVAARYWFRVPVDQDIVIDCGELLAAPEKVIRKELVVRNSETRLELHIFARTPFGPASGDPRVRFITFTLVNRTSASEKPKDEDCFFQCGIKIRADSEENCFPEYPEGNPDTVVSDEEGVLSLLYRHRKTHAVGHGCSADWSDGDSRGCARIWTDTLPSYEIRPILPSALDNIALPMREFASGGAQAWINSCDSLANRYADWIGKQYTILAAETGLSDVQVHAARKNLDECRSCLDRIRDGVAVLRDNARASQAFELMNQAMLMQHLHYQLSTSGRRTWTKTSKGLVLTHAYSTPDYASSNRSWHPFQLAFILTAVSSIVLGKDEDYTQRDVVDLIWFPTGGGKTEAYLGLTAFTIFFRRLSNPSNSGTTALMRYTLRLLTTQQYQRAASLICACEKIRRGGEVSLGSDPITIGLWVGGSVTPNNEKVAEHALDKLLRGERENPFIILSCPWCGAEMGSVRDGTHFRAKGYRRLSSPKRVRLVCEDPDCDFNNGEGLPLQIIDEDIYARPPTLLVGTVDKFALLPWYPAARSLFGMVNKDVDPPDLIIQDELHLISGPLGSMVGHYEAVIDALCRRTHGTRQVSAKIIASTATISRAPEQVKALYGGRGTSLFPPQALKAGDSYFAQEQTSAEGRLYVGVFASGLPSQTTTELRVLSALLQGAALAIVRDASERDPYWTLMVYFNSIRELGHAATLLKADIPEYTSVTWRRLGLDAKWGDEAIAARRYINRDMELTSRVQNSEITECMDRLSTSYPSSKGNPAPIDVCLATNMIQVGLDVSRLSLMAIIGQPKTTSEYIQASSRVGRSTSPGLVVTILSPSKPRDRSHFEHFRAFHQSIYRYVEPTSVTPFAVPVSHRAIHALIITLARFWGSEHQRLYPDAPDAGLQDRIRKELLRRVEAVEPSELQRVARRIDAIFAEWRRLPPDTYGKFGPPGDEVPFMYPTGVNPQDRWDARAYPTPSSMRNVDASCNAEVVGNYPDPAGGGV